VLEHRCANEVVVKRRNGLTGMDESEDLERRLVGAFEENRLTDLELWGERLSDVAKGKKEKKETHIRDVRVFGGFLAVVVDDGAAHTDVRDDGRVLLL
jgi:hypothetical protein